MKSPDPLGKGEPEWIVTDVHGLVCVNVDHIGSYPGMGGI